MAANSTIILNSSSHNNTSNNTPIVGEKYKGAGFYGMGDGFHTVQIQITNFTGSIKIQGTLASAPTEADWIDINFGDPNSFTIDTTGSVSVGELLNIVTSTNTSLNKVYNFTGNFVWLRANVVTWTAGSINRIMLNF